MKKKIALSNSSSFNGVHKQLFYIPTRHGAVAALLCMPELKRNKKRKRLTLICSHGFALDNNMVENGRMFLRLAEKLAKQRISTLLFAYPGMAESDGMFRDISPNLRIETLQDVLAWFADIFNESYGVLGFSMGAATAIHAVAKLKKTPQPKFLITVNAVPSFNLKAKSYAQWHSMVPQTDIVVGIQRKFFKNAPKQPFARVYSKLRYPKLHIQSGNDIAHFAEEFRTVFDADTGNEDKTWIDLPGADHACTLKKHRNILLSKLVKWIVDRY